MILARRVFFMWALLLPAVSISTAAGIALPGSSSDAAMLTVLKDLKPVTQSLTFNAADGFHWRCTLQRKFTYTLLLDIGYDPKTKMMEDRTPDLLSLKKFIAEAESDTRGRLILENNTSGLPAFISLTGRGTGVKFKIHHPFHAIDFSPVDKQWAYSYSGTMATFARLPEIKRAMSNAGVSAFVGAASATVHVSASGSPQSFFDCSFFKDDGTALKVRVEGKNVTAMPTGK